MRKVWHINQCDVDVYLEDENGAIDGASILKYCYMQNVTVQGTLAINRRPVTGRAKMKITAGAWEYTMSVEHLYINKSAELDAEQIFNREQKLALVMRAVDDILGNEDDHTLRHAIATSFRVIGAENDTLKCSAEFAAEDFV